MKQIEEIRVTACRKVQQVHGGDQSPHPPSWSSFVGTGIHDGPVPPAIRAEQKLFGTECDTHTVEILRTELNCHVPHAHLGT